jgi:hypothetical protein
MNGVNAWDGTERQDCPRVLKWSNVTNYYDFQHGSLRWARVLRGSTLYNGWVLCNPSGKPITYADNSQPGAIRVSASGTYMTQ